MSEIRYFRHDGIDGDYFECPSGMGSLSTRSCAANYSLAMSPQGLREGRRITCRSCPVGALHAGVPQGGGSVSRFVGSGICARCQREAPRLIRRAICVCCYNREREVLRGKNAKGKRPVRCRAVQKVRMAVILGSVCETRQFDVVASLAEARIITLRSEAKACVFGWVSAPRVALNEDSTKN